ncbi:MAG: aminotransferase [Candidatus Omnitrophica bacterium CG07_land_8_20_14_0_80_42_15]|uniref:Aminotransferase n=1 Tax=Candidatus Aquitaenariimonas noxiae TaxID=1974741 RepID=A0A2J0KTL8_9BACT|nr:MAG: aminotransferase [Candidatus Omnitrophica bacterium CG07_land_8_20_14_0_80_42_15]
MRKKYLMTPGPTPIPPEVLLEMAKPILHHRTPQYQAIFKEVNEGLKYVFQTSNDIVTLASSGTGAMEASIVNLLSKGDKAIVIRGGKFGERFAEICSAYGVEVIPIDIPEGNAPQAPIVRDTLAKNPKAKALYVNLCETSSGSVYDIKSIAEITKKTSTVLVVDAISGLGADDIQTDNWGVDIVVSGSQKGLMMPPGLAFLAISQKAWKAMESSTLPKYYFDLKKAKKALDKTDTPFTPAVSLVIGLREALRMIKEETAEKMFARHKKLADATRESVKALGLELFSKSPSNAVTAVKVPAGIDGEKLVKNLRDVHGVTIAGGQDELKGKIFRVAHLGFMEKFDVITAISAIEIGLKELGYKFELGSGVKVAEKMLAEG